jgi:hypothetical protein
MECVEKRASPAKDADTCRVARGCFEPQRERRVLDDKPDVPLKLLRQAADSGRDALAQTTLLRQGAARALRVLCRTEYSYICGTRARVVERCEPDLREQPPFGIASFGVRFAPLRAIMIACSGSNDSKVFANDSTSTRSG